MPHALGLEAPINDINAVDCFGDATCHWPLKRNNIGAARVLLGGTVIPNITGRWERSALLYAVRGPRLASTKALIASDANGTFTDAEGFTALHQAAMFEGFTHLLIYTFAEWR